jgi:hypothetical protein
MDNRLSGYKEKSLPYRDLINYNKGITLPQINFWGEKDLSEAYNAKGAITCAFSIP